MLVIGVGLRFILLVEPVAGRCYVVRSDEGEELVGPLLLRGEGGHRHLLVHVRRRPDADRADVLADVGGRGHEEGDVLVQQLEGVVGVDRAGAVAECVWRRTRR